MESSQSCEDCSVALLTEARGPSHPAENLSRGGRRIQATCGSWNGEGNPIARGMESVYTDSVLILEL
jgi:hypothetical protein